ncbi:MAG: hypothetical protein IPK18_08000 [Sphingobacteriales bacterium]|nr:MAG: hypothetical protein IPK18_08000 [Sphingobacteriales bacterium]
MQKKKAEPDSAEVYTNSIPTIKNQLKGLIGQNLFNYNIYYQITNPQNPIYAKALADFLMVALKNSEYYNQQKLESIILKAKPKHQKQKNSILVQCLQTLH